MAVGLSDKKKNCLKCLGCNRLEQKTFTSLQVCNNYIQNDTNKELLFEQVKLKE